MINVFQDFEFVAYTSEKANSHVSDRILHIAPTLVSEVRGEDFIVQGKLQLPGYVNMDQDVRVWIYSFGPGYEPVAHSFEDCSELSCL
jgi:hypothetical protein